MSLSAVTTTPAQVTPHSVVQCLNCGSMAKNFLYLESFLKTNISKKTPCKNCSAVLQYLEYLNKNIEEVFRTIKLSSGKNFGSMNKINSDIKSTNAILNDVNVLKKPVTRKPSLVQKSKTNLRNAADSGKIKIINQSNEPIKKDEISKEIKSAIRKQAGHDKQPIDKQMKKLKSELSKLSTKKKIMSIPTEKSLEKNTKLLIKPKKRRYKQVSTSTKKLINKKKTDIVL